ncbi:hypothetical protein BDN72DRAFT_901719 [Pluteus cervinus]|uniref:Uncharacterized protein n=1 Tax=Pluteus cervinus TaxID=181527 RepID=A0ACD3AHA6_9AGAR|nr:hypothetical protein BDN72DRAFT_901719 [Pluteus cervinus]
MVKQIDPLAVNLIGTWCEVLLFGVYTTLFLESTVIMFERYSRRSFSARLFTAVMCVIYMVAVAHIGVGLYRLIKGYVWIEGSEAQLRYWSIAFARPMEATLVNLLQVAVITMADFLLIYRCYIVWSRTFWVIIPSIILALANFSANIATITLWAMLGALRGTHYTNLLNSIFPTAIVQNVLTTGLIIYRLIRQHKESRAAGVHDTSSRLSLRNVGLIMLESAAIYTCHLLLTLILYILNFDGQFILVDITVPIIGITWSLIAVRLHRVAHPTSIISANVFTVSAPQWAQDQSQNIASMHMDTSQPALDIEMMKKGTDTKIDV